MYLPTLIAWTRCPGMGGNPELGSTIGDSSLGATCGAATLGGCIGASTAWLSSEGGDIGVVVEAARVGGAELSAREWVRGAHLVVLQWRYPPLWCLRAREMQALRWGCLRAFHWTLGKSNECTWTAHPGCLPSRLERSETPAGEWR